MVGPFGLKPKGTMAARALPLAKALTRRGHNVALIVPPWSYPRHAGYIWIDDGVLIENVPIAPRGQIPFSMNARVGTFRPDVLHVFKPKAYSGIVQWITWQPRVFRLKNLRIVLDEDDWEGAGGWNELEPYSWVQKKFFAWQEKWGLTHADAITVASRALETIVWSLGVARERVLYLPNGVNPLPPSREPRAQIRAELGLGDAPTILLYTRFFEFKLERLGEILWRVFKLLPNAKLLLVGKGLFGEEKKFLEMSTAQGWQERVINAGWVEEARLRAYFSAVDVAIYPFDDTLVNRTKAAVKLMDLLAAGVPIVADAVGQIREYIQDNETGILIAPNDVERFAKKTVELLSNADMRERLGACAAVQMTREYEWDKLAERVESLYRA
ncbi:MAG TPA: glycosyltransferase family 4 protein [Anaerolineae bacterium]|nr:glycosyltransferase family 4 protein [Anaerolineae bacterium]